MAKVTQPGSVRAGIYLSKKMISRQFSHRAEKPLVAYWDAVDVWWGHQSGSSVRKTRDPEQMRDLSVCQQVTMYVDKELLWRDSPMKD